MATSLEMKEAIDAQLAEADAYETADTIHPKLRELARQAIDVSLDRVLWPVTKHEILARLAVEQAELFEKLDGALAGRGILPAAWAQRAPSTP